jgi:predicted nuclease with RNAse H fold
MNSEIIAIGWDVRGWLGKQQAVAVVKLDLSGKKPQPQWWVSDDFQFEKDKPLCLASIVIPALGLEYQSHFENVGRVVIGIDASLAFPRGFIDLMNHSGSEFAPTAAEIDNPLAYRDCERWIYETHGKKPLSASFDKLGNGATLAMAMCHALNKEGFVVIPQDADQADRAVIEVYPALVKQESKRVSAAIDLIHRLIPDVIEVGSDQYDAAICAIVAAVYAGAGTRFGLPELVDFDPNFDRAEGWVYSFSPEYIKSCIK